MLTRRTLSAVLLIVSPLMQGCGAHKPTKTPAASPPDKAQAVAAEPRGIRGELPQVKPRIVAETEPDAPNVALREPLSHATAIPVVRQFLRAMFTNNPNAAISLVEPDATARPFQKKGTVPLLQMWENRLQNTLVSDLGPALPIDTASLRCYAREQLPSEAPGANLRGKHLLFVHVHMSPTHIASKRVLPDDMWFILVPAGSSYRISRVIAQIRH